MLAAHWPTTYTARGLALFDSDEWRPDAHQLRGPCFRVPETEMNFQQLQDHPRGGTAATHQPDGRWQALFTSQSGVSKHIKDLEDELGVELFVRKGKRLLGLTDPGNELLVFVERILLDCKQHQESGGAIQQARRRTS